MDQDNAVNALAALAQGTRLDAFRALVRAGPTGLPAGAIAAAVGARQNTLSTHLLVLANAGLVRRVREGRMIRYSADFDRMGSLLRYLLEDCCCGDASICASLPSLGSS